MATDATRYFIGEFYAADVGVGFLVMDSRKGAADPSIDEATARAIVGAIGGNPNVTLSPVNLSEISQEEFEFYRAAEISAPGLPDGLTVIEVRK
ncbi:MAG: hypothetical protein ABIR29_03465 [Chthoniobacterales bacterium]